jgi:hypothetical protein
MHCNHDAWVSSQPTNCQWTDIPFIACLVWWTTTSSMAWSIMWWSPWILVGWIIKLTMCLWRNNWWWMKTFHHPTKQKNVRNEEVMDHSIPQTKHSIKALTTKLTMLTSNWQDISRHLTLNISAGWCTGPEGYSPPGTPQPVQTTTKAPKSNTFWVLISHNYGILRVHWNKRSNPKLPLKHAKLARLAQEGEGNRS